jgi:CRP-like cAMP-binding protein
VTSTTPVELLGLTEWVFRGLLVEHPSIALKTLESLAGRLREASQTSDV